MKYSIEIGKIIEGALKFDATKVTNYTKQLTINLENDGEVFAARKFSKLLSNFEESSLSLMNSGKDSIIPVDSESRLTLAEIIYPDVSDFDVILSENNQKELLTFITAYSNADKLSKFGLDIPNSMLLFGPPGCGKSRCARYIANTLKMPLVVARLDSLISSYLGTTSKNIRSLFDYAQKTPCVLFLDEFDAIAKARDDANELGELKRVVNSLIQNVDMMSSSSILIAATNHDSLLDYAVWRRFEYKMVIDYPDYSQISRMIDLFINGYYIIDESDKIQLSLALKGLSGANVEEIIKKSMRNSIVHNTEFSKIMIFNEIFNFKDIGKSSKLHEGIRNQLLVKTKFLRECDSKVFSYSVIAEILGVSKSTVSKLMTSEGEK